MLAAMPVAAGGGIVPAMTRIATHTEDQLVRAWRAEQLIGLGVVPVLAYAFADSVDWHEVAPLVRRGCPPMLAFEIVR